MTMVLSQSHVTGALRPRGPRDLQWSLEKSHILPLMSNFGRDFSQMAFESYYLNRTHYIERVSIER